jgi:hypothetical protein
MGEEVGGRVDRNDVAAGDAEGFAVQAHAEKYEQN